MIFTKNLQLICRSERTVNAEFSVDNYCIAFEEYCRSHFINVCQIEHSRHRSCTNFMVNIVFRTGNI
ncbi:hypothetical protein [Clostridium sp.]|uniref:hypothetical protein n=1 Tax=Clostridium sp. TaxID=1506 RepID=UPI00359F6A9A